MLRGRTRERKAGDLDEAFLGDLDLAFLRLEIFLAVATAEEPEYLIGTGAERK